MQTESDRLMAIIDTLKFRNILVNGKIAEEGPAEELVQALDDAFTEQLDDVVTKEHLSAEMRALRAEILQALADMEARLQRQMLFAVGIIVAAIAAAATLLAVFG